MTAKCADKTGAIVFRLTVPVWHGPAAFMIRAALGFSDLGAVLAKGQRPAAAPDTNHQAFDIELEEGVGLGGDTRLGMLEILNDGGQLRITLPAGWRGVLERHVERVELDTVDGKHIVRGWTSPKVGAEVQIPVPIGTGRHIGIRVLQIT